MQRLLRTEYSGAAGDRVAASATLIGAIRAAVVRLALGEYKRATIYDHRFGTGNAHAWCVTVHLRSGSIVLRWPSNFSIAITTERIDVERHAAIINSPRKELQ